MQQDEQSAAAADAEVPAEHDVPDVLELAGLFPPATREQWREAVAGVLRRSKAASEDLPDPVEEALRRPVATGVTVAPLYTAEDAGDLVAAAGLPGLPPFVRGSRPAVGPAGSPAVSAAGGVAGGAPASWDVRQRHAHPDVATTRQAIAADLENGVTSLWLALGDGAVPVDALGDVLADVHLDLAPVAVSGGAPAAEALLALLDGRGDVAPGGSLGLDPLGLQAATGAEQPLDGLAGFARRAAAHGLRTVVADGTVFSDAGASPVEELGCALAAGVAYLRALTDSAEGGQGLTVDEAFGAVEFRLSASADQFTTIAALRAARRLWNRVGELSGASADVRAMRLHAVTSSVMTTRRDPYVNMLRTTVACFAAGVGGADVVTVQPFDAALGLPDAFARRIARNTSSLLVEEGSVARVLDPAGGSWYVESLTDSLARAAWDWFTEIERAGGLASALSSGLVAARVGDAWAERFRRLARRSEPITGVSEFPDLEEKVPVRQPAAAPPSGGLVRVRAAEAFEALRDAADAVSPRPAVYLATLGPVARHTARAGFAASLFQAGGLATPSGDGASGLADAGTTVACICGTDPDYAQAPALAAELRAAGAEQVWLAGKPSLEVAGVDGYVFAGCSALGVLQTVHDTLGIPALSAESAGEGGRR